MRIQKITALVLISLMAGISILFMRSKPSALPLVAIANFGPHTSLDASIQGIKQELRKNGFIEQENIRYEIADVGFDASLIPQMINNIKNHHPRVLVVITTPVAQYAKATVKDIPLIYSVITDPVAAGLIKSSLKPDANMTGSSDQQNLQLLFKFAKKILPHPTKVGILYSTAESNDIALIHMMKQAARLTNMQVLEVPIEQTRDIPQAMHRFNHQVDFIYVGASGAIQPALPVIAAESRKMNIPVFNVNETAVAEHMVLASFGVNYHQVGVNTGRLITQVLQGKPIASLPPNYPKLQDYHGFVSAKNATALGLSLPQHLQHIQIVR